MSVVIPPQIHPPDHLCWTIGHLEIHARHHQGAWYVSRPWSEQPLLLADRPSVAVRLGLDEAVAHLEHAVVLAPRAMLSLWVAWPLEVVIRGARQEIIDVHRRGMRRTLLGAVDTGRVMKGAWCATVPSAYDAPAWTHAALRVELHNPSQRPATIRRLPIAERGLSLARQGDHLAAGTLQVTVQDARVAEARIAAWQCPHAFAVASRDRAEERRELGWSLAWLLDATRRSTGFQL